MNYKSLTFILFSIFNLSSLAFAEDNKIISQEKEVSPLSKEIAKGSSSKDLSEDKKVKTETQEEKIDDIDSERISRETESNSAEREILGWVERIVVYPEKITMDAKLTPGSEGNVMHATDIKVFKKDNSKWVKFKTLNRKGNAVEVERELVDKTSFRQTDSSFEKRYVVKFGVCLASKYIELDFALSDRAGFEQESRIGRDALAGHFLVDPGRTKVKKPKCFKSKK